MCVDGLSCVISLGVSINHDFFYGFLLSHTNITVILGPRSRYVFRAALICVSWFIGKMTELTGKHERIWSRTTLKLLGL